MIDLEREVPVTLAEAPKLIPAINAIPGMDARKTMHPRTLYNWSTRGKRGVVLETVPIGGILVTTREALQRFFLRLASSREQQRLDRRQPERQPARRRNIDHQGTMQKLASRHGI